MSFLLVGAAVVGVGAGVAKAISGGKQKKAAKAAEKKAKAEMEKQKAKFAAMDTSNPYANMENTMEDLTVNQGEAEFMKQQQQESQANIMQNMQGAAGGSGIASMAQAMANASSKFARQSSASIGQQEAQNNMMAMQNQSKIDMMTAQEKSKNQMMIAKGAQDVDVMKAKGDALSMQMEQSKQGTLLGMDANRLGAARQAQMQASQQIAGGVGTMLQAGYLKTQ